MNTLSLSPTIASAFRPGLSLEDLRGRAPAVFAPRAYTGTSATYRFISTAELVEALLGAGFLPTEARQTRSRGDRAGYGRHLLRFRPTRQEVLLEDAVPEIVILNSHDGTTAYQVRAGLYRPVCTNGLMTRLGDFGLIYVPHRGNVVANVIEAAQRLLGEFQQIESVVRRMAVTYLSDRGQLEFAEAALRLRYPDGFHPVGARQLLTVHRSADVGDDVWKVYNVIQENVMRGGLVGRSASGRLIRTRGIRAIKEDVKLNTGLWQAAVERIAA